MLGPNPAVGDAQAFFDSDGSGGPSPCDQPVLPLYDAILDRITLPNPFQDCDGSGNLHNQFDIHRDGSSTPIDLVRDRGDQTETLTPTGFFEPFQPMSGQLDIIKGGDVVKSGQGHLVQGGGGFFNGVAGGQTLGGSTSAYISRPWSEIAALGLLGHIQTNCPTDAPQVFVPLSNGRIVLDLNGDGVPDPGLFSSPPLTRQAAVGFGVPAVSRGTMALLAAALVGVGLFQLRRGGLGF
jgi:hypothetical protein